MSETNMAATTQAPNLVDTYAALNGGLPVYRHGDETYLIEAQGRIADTSGWTGDAVPSGGWLCFSAADKQQKSRHYLGAVIPAGTRVRVSWRQRGDGRARLRLGRDNVCGYLANPGRWATDLTVTSERSFIEVLASGMSGAVEVTDVTVRALDPAASDYDIIALAGQSNMVGASSGSRPDAEIDLPHPDIDVMHGGSTKGHLSTDGEITAAIPSLQHRNMNSGLGPGMSFARWYADNLVAPGRRVLLVATAKGGTALLNNAPSGPQDGSDAPWHPLNSLPADLDLYTRAVESVTAAMALGGDNRLVAMLWSQGESDRGADSAPIYRQAFSQCFAPSFRSDTGVPGLPIVIIGLNPAVDDANTNAMRAEQAMLDMDSGHADAVPNCIHCAWDQTAWGNGTKPKPENNADHVHYGTDANRVRGVDAARKLKARLFTAAHLTFHGEPMTFNGAPMTME